MTNNPNGCESFMTGLRALGEGFGFFFSGLWIACQIWYAKAMNWFCRPIAIPQWGLLAGSFAVSFGVLSISHLSKIDLPGNMLALAGL